MAASRSSLAALATAVATAATCLTAQSNVAHADGVFRFSPFSSSSPADSQMPSPAGSDSKAAEVEESRGGFDPESLERGAKALREINSSPHSKKVGFVGKYSSTCFSGKKSLSFFFFFFFSPFLLWN